MRIWLRPNPGKSDLMASLLPGEYEVAPRSSTDLSVANGDARASRSSRKPATRTGSRVASATAEGRLPLTPPADAGTSSEDEFA